jgi:hypothetical protein
MMFVPAFGGSFKVRDRGFGKLTVIGHPLASNKFTT